ncbi:MAG: hypothetical protein FGM14_14105 [Flavobacteriales bacterium]|nr:hypothetical protein [Flavobacteriales bacterium]
MKILFIIVISILFCIILLLYWKFLNIYEEIMIEKYNLTDKEIETHNKRCRHANYDCSLKDYLN